MLTRRFAVGTALTAAITVGLAMTPAQAAGPAAAGPSVVANNGRGPKPAVPESKAIERKGTPSHANTRLLAPTDTLSSTLAASTTHSAGHLNLVGGPDVVTNASGAVLAQVTDRTARRVAGPDRYATSVALSQMAFPSTAPVAVIASGLNFPDGLAASPVAVALGGPLLLVGATVPPSVASELSRLKPTQVIVAGGEEVVTPSVVAAIAKLLPSANILRAQGLDRYATAQALASLLPPQDASKPTVAFVATGITFPDALSAGPVAGSRNAPVLLTNPDRLSPPAEAALATLHPKLTYVIGNQMAAGVLSAIRAATGGDVEVIGGPDRYATAALVAAHFFKPTVPGVTIAAGLNYPDALSAGSLAYLDAGPILLDPGRSSPSSVTLDETKALSWWLPPTGKVLRYIPVVHPDDEMSSAAVNLPIDDRRYDVFILLTAGETTSYCDGKPVSNPWATQQYLPQPQPTGLPGSDLCKKQRRDSWNTFLEGTPDGSGVVYQQLTGTDVSINGRPLPTPERLDASGATVPATDIKAWIGPTSARFEFDLGALTPDAAIWAIENVRALRASMLPTSEEGDIVGAGYVNTTPVGSYYEHPDHMALYSVLSTVDFGLPGSQYDAVGPVQSGRAFGSTVPGYCGLMCHPADTSGFKGPMGHFQYSYGWLRSGEWATGVADVSAGFSQYQNFGKWF